MDQSTKKKVRIVLIAFCILIIPFGYLIAISYAIQIHDHAMKLALLHAEDKTVTQNAIIELDKAIKIYSWNYLNYMDKARLQMELQDYQGALISARKGTDKKNQYVEGLVYQGLIYEYLNRSDSAKIYYSKAIEKYKERLNKNHKDWLTNQLDNRTIALLYTFTGDKENAKKHLTIIPDTTSLKEKQVIERFDFYMENYLSGGLKDYESGEKIRMINDSITDNYKLDSLIYKSRIFSDAHQSIQIPNQKEKVIYEFKLIFKDKAKAIGFKEVGK